MKELARSNKLLMLLLTIYVLTGAFILFYFQRGDFELLVNQNHTYYLDEFYYYITYLGDGWGSAFILFLMFLRRIYDGMVALFSLLSSTFIVQGLKRYVFYDVERPIRFFADKIKSQEIELHRIEGLELHTIYSFPSGHSSGAFAVFIVLCLVSKNKMWTWLFFTLALLVTVSRIYLLQHFFIDTYFGALTGSFCAIMMYHSFEYRSNLSENIYLKRPLLKLFDKQS